MGRMAGVRDAGIELTLDICRRHDIEPSFYYPSTTFDFPRCFQVATIVCHSNCRRDKTDNTLLTTYRLDAGSLRTEYAVPAKR